MSRILQLFGVGAWDWLCKQSEHGKQEQHVTPQVTMNFRKHHRMGLPMSRIYHLARRVFAVITIPLHPLLWRAGLVRTSDRGVC